VKISINLTSKGISVKRLFIFALILLVGCQGSDTSVATRSSQSSDLHSGRVKLRTPDSCGEYETELEGGGGKLSLVALADGSFDGTVKYASFKPGGETVFVIACPGSENDNNVPVPVGYAADWFCEVEVAHQATLTFEPAALGGTLDRANTLSPKTKYYMYIYDSSNNLLESYLMGPYKKKRETIKFASPFENGFVLPGTINLEIAHPTQ
jgi:hypothetical protein